MTVYVDTLRTRPVNRQARRNGQQWCHMVADTLHEMHAMAARLGLRPEDLRRGKTPHYNLTGPKRAAAVRMGAREVEDRIVAIQARLLGLHALQPKTRERN